MKGGTAVEDQAAVTQSSDRQRQLQRLMLDCFLVLIPALALYCYNLIRLKNLGDGDTGWHIAAGKWIVAHRAVPSTDIFSYTAVGKAWTAHEWLADVLMGLAHGLAGWSGVLLLYAIAMAALGLIMALYLRRWLEPKLAALVLGGVIAGLMPFLLSRPHVTAWPVLAAWTVMLLRAREQDRAPPLWAALLITLWANLHGSFIFGLLLIGPFAAEALFSAPAQRRMRVFREWAIFGIASLIAALVTPYGLHGLLFPFQLTAMPVLGAIEEWLPSDFSTLGVFEVVLLGGLTGCLWLGVKIPLWRLAVVIGMLHMALAHSRHQAVFLIVTSLILACPLARALGKGDPRFNLRTAIAERRRDVQPLFVMMALLALGMTVWRVAVPAVRPDSLNVPATAMAKLPLELKRARVFNEYSFGGSLALEHVPVYIDGRADMYGEKAMRDYLDLADRPDAAKWQAAVRQWGIQWTFLPPGKPLVRLLDNQPGWRRIYADHWAVIHVKDTPARPGDAAK